MSKQYIQQLEEANEMLKNALERESMLKEIESNRHKRWYRVEIHHIGRDNIDMALKSEDTWGNPPIANGDACHLYDVPGMEAARAIVLTHLWMRRREDDELGGGISWIVKLASKRHKNGTWNPSIYLRQGWIVICKHYPAWGGSYIRHHPSTLGYGTVGVTESHFHNYTDYAKWVQEKEKES